jgi:hypothetical protein
MKKQAVKRQNPESKAVKPVRWKPASRLGTISTPEGYRARWVHDTPDNISKKKAEGWEILDKSKFPKIGGGEYENQVTDSKGLTSTVLKRNELIAMVIPEEMAQERDEYYRRETEDATQSALSHSETRELIKKINPKNKKSVVSINPTDAGVSVID